MLERRAKHAAEAARTERDRLALVPTFDASEIDMLEGLLEAFQAADHAAKNGGESSARVGKLVRRGEKVRDALRAAARFYLRGDAAMTNELGAVSAGDRPEELARELAALVTLVKLRPTSADDPDLEKAVRRAESIGGELATLPDDGERDAAYAKRSQIGLLLADSVDEVGAALRYVYRDKPKKLARLA